MAASLDSFATLHGVALYGVNESSLSKADKTEFTFVAGTESPQDAAESSSENNNARGLAHTRHQPSWIRTGDWVVGQQHVFTVDQNEVVYI